MKHSFKYCTVIAIAFSLILIGVTGPRPAGADPVCDAGVATPPFLGGGVDPNLLLMIDNSGSMLDLAYVDDANYCLDDSFDDTKSYAGYFERTNLYIYDLTTNQFRRWEPSVYALWPSTHTYYYYTIGVAYVKYGGTPMKVTGFVASGNFLNWASASKIDIQKEILTGGKYEAAGGIHDPSGTHPHLIMESRGCLERRFVKKIQFKYKQWCTPACSATADLSQTGYLTLSVRPPKTPSFDQWKANTAYTIGNIVDDGGDLFKCTAAGTSGTISVDDDNAVGAPRPAWVLYTKTRWTSGASYVAGDIVVDPKKANTIDEGQLYIASTSGTATGTGGVETDAGVVWLPYNVTYLEIFETTLTGFDNSACQSAIDEFNDPSPNQGLIKQDIDKCLTSDPLASTNTGDISNFNAAFNHSIHNCWYAAKQSGWPPGSGPVQAIKPACEAIYPAAGPLNPWNITPDNGAYACYGLWDGDGDATTNTGFVGRCWKPGSGAPVCTKWKPGSDHSDPANCQKWDDSLVTPGGWDAAGYTDADACIEQGLKDYCGMVEIPQVIDPSDQAGDVTGVTEEFWNIPALLTDSGVVAQLGQPLLTMRGLIAQTTVPSGLIQEFADDIRMGVMVFNYEGSKSECSASDPFVLYNCTNPANRDGSAVIANIDQSSAHTTTIVNSINGIKATSWTPIAEAIYNAIGYYAQRSDMRIDNNDFSINSTADPIKYYCQDNNILIITEGASTADVNPSVVNFVNDPSYPDRRDADTGDTTVGNDCGNLDGSTLLDDLTWFAKNSSNCHTTQMLDAENVLRDKQNIATHIVVAGTLRDTGSTSECNPKVLLEQAASNGGTALYDASDPNQLETRLREAFAAIRAGAAAGSAASVISASRSGEGAAYQAIFWPSVELNNGEKVNWIGEVHALLVDAQGQLYEDTVADHKLVPKIAGVGDDERVVFYFDENQNQTYACIGGLESNGTCLSTNIRDLSQVKYHWSAARWLSDILPKTAQSAYNDATDSILLNRAPVSPGTTAGYISNVKRRLIFTWSDLDNDGVVDSGEIIDFTPNAKTWSTAGLGGGSGTRGAMTLDFSVSTDAQVNQIIRWLRGLDHTPDNLRLRQRRYDFGAGEEDITWRLGDVIHSTPISVAAPGEGFHFLYQDASYASFVKRYKKRRHMIYFGANDGMMHAVNGGFYDELNKRFCRTQECLGDQNLAPELGAEMWAYVPYNLLPHLKCMTDVDYAGTNHKYYVDQRPRIFDVKIFADDGPNGVHPGGWGTILVGAMRFGGAKIDANTIDPDNNGPDYPGDTRKFTSSYFVFDITDPERQPTLLAEATRTTDATEAEMGFTLAVPTLVVMKEGTDYQWYLVMGSGPTNVNATSNQAAKVAVLPMSRLLNGDHFRIPGTAPGVSNFGSFTLTTAQSFVSDLISVDFELEQNYKTDVVYFGTVSGASAAYGGAMNRLVTRKIDSGTQVATVPNEWSSLLSADSLTNPLPLINTVQPVTAPASVGYDGKNYWVYFGTGRFLDVSDKTDASVQGYYGIKEPMVFGTTADGCQGNFTWQTVEKTGNHNAADYTATPPLTGNQGLLQVDQFLIRQAASATASYLYCRDGTTDCLDVDASTTLSNFESLVNYIVGTGTGCNVTDSSGKDGWYKEFLATKERNVGQATLLGGLLTYTSYQPYDDLCLPEGLGALYGVYYQTGTSFFIPVFLRNYDNPLGVDVDNNVIDKVSLGRGLATTPNLHVGKEEGSKAFVQTSTGTIVEIPQPNLPLQNAKTGKTSWGEMNLLKQP